MSELYDAIKKIESREKKKHDLPEFSGKKKSKPPYLLIVSALFFVVFAVSAGLFVLYKVRSIQEEKLNTKKKVAVRIEKKTNATKKNTVNSEPQRAVSGVVVKKEKSNPIKKTRVIEVNKKPVKMANVESRTVFIKRQVVNKVKVEKKKVSRNLTREHIKKVTVKYNVNALLEEAESGDFSRSIKAYKTLIKIYPSNISLYNNLAAEYIDAGMYKEAVRVLNRALSIKDDPDIRINLAICYVKLGQFGLARRILENVTPPESDRSVYNRLMYILNSNQ